ncbi:hypothetical protein B0H34DRAFT_671841 [Crassisporium funariophilum]|nr:hypothetical protein B0H34DRAFT_671841 [Crassisporium funariophilum]
MEIPKGKRPKHFLEKNEALMLAASIAEVQEKKSSTRTEKHHKLQAGQPKEVQKPGSSAKAKIKETKALLASKRARAKKDKAKLRKRRANDGTLKNKHPEGTSSESPVKTARKSVSFA